MAWGLYSRLFYVCNGQADEEGRGGKWLFPLLHVTNLLFETHLAFVGAIVRVYDKSRCGGGRAKLLGAHAVEEKQRGSKGCCKVDGPVRIILSDELAHAGAPSFSFGPPAIFSHHQDSIGSSPEISLVRAMLKFRFDRR